eukprot:UN22689
MKKSYQPGSSKDKKDVKKKSSQPGSAEDKTEVEESGSDSWGISGDEKDKKGVSDSESDSSEYDGDEVPPALFIQWSCPQCTFFNIGPVPCEQCKMKCPL